MINFTKVVSTSFGSAGKRFVKILRLGKSDVQTPVEAGPYGVDSNPIKDMVAVYAPTGIRGKTVIVGYLNKNQKAALGEMRTFATDADGVEKFYIWQKADGTCEIGGDADNMVRYLKLNIALQQQVTDINAELVKIAAAINAIVPLSYTPAPISLDISDAKIDEIKTI